MFHRYNETESPRPSLDDLIGMSQAAATLGLAIRVAPRTLEMLATAGAEAARVAGGASAGSLIGRVRSRARASARREPVAATTTPSSVAASPTRPASALTLR